MDTTTNNHTSGISITKGVFLVILGIVAMVWPQYTIAFVVATFGLFAIASGIMGVIVGIFSIGRGWKWLLDIIIGLVAMFVGVLIFTYPVVSTATYVWLLGLYFVIGGFVSLIRDRNNGHDSTARSVSIVDGSLSIILGLLLLIFPVGTSVTFYWILAIYAVIAGIIMIFTAARINREYKRHLEQTHSHV